MRRGLTALVAICALVLLPAATAQASFHEIKIREVFLGHSLFHTDAYIELQAYAASQNLLAGHVLTTYQDDGSPSSSGCQFPDKVPNTASQMTVLVGASASAGSPDLTCNLNIDAIGGAACWGTDQPTPLDCVSWGTFSGSVGSPTGTPFTVPGEDTAMRRSIAAGCPSLLEPSDDSNDSAADFQPATPNPRNNSSPITETSCGGGGGGGGGKDNTPPQTKIGKVKVSGTTAKLTFSGNDPARPARAAGLSFKCKLDKGKFKKCSSPKKFKHLKRGQHKVQVEAIDSAGNVDPTPAKKRFKV